MLIKSVDRLETDLHCMRSAASSRAAAKASRTIACVLRVSSLSRPPRSPLSLSQMRSQPCFASFLWLVAMSALRGRLGDSRRGMCVGSPTMDSDPSDQIDRLVLVRLDFSGARRLLSHQTSSRRRRCRLLVDERRRTPPAQRSLLAQPCASAFRFWPVVMGPPCACQDGQRWVLHGERLDGCDASSVSIVGYGGVSTASGSAFRHDHQHSIPAHHVHTHHTHT